MNMLKMEISQYIGIHPILNKDLKLRRKYLILLNYFCGIDKKNNIWERQLWNLYADKIAGECINAAAVTAKDLNILQKFKFMKYRYYILIDALFITSYELKSNGSIVFEKIIKFFGERYRRKMQMVFDAFYSEYDKRITNTIPELEAIYKVIWNNRLFVQKQEKRIMITANMSAGKSTLINALIGKKINKTLNDTCTAKIHYLYNKASEDGLTYEYDHDLNLDASNEILMTDNEENHTLDIYVGTRFRSTIDIDKRVCFIDTPGVNSSMNKNHREISEGAIKDIKCDLLIYLFNGENIGTEDDIKHLKFVKKNYSGKIIFLINRVDKYKVDIDSVKDTLEKERNDLKRLGFENPRIYPISAYAGYLCKMVMNGEDISEYEIEEMNDMKRILKRKEFSYEQYYENSEHVTVITDTLEQLLLNSGIKSLEQLLYE